jgi:hypothetical protein
MSRAEGFFVAACVLLLASLLAAIAAFTILSGPAQFPKGGTHVYCGSAWQVLFDEPSRQGENPRTTWSEPCQAAANDVWLRTRPWTAAAGVFAVAAVCMWWGRRRSLKRERTAMASIGDRKSEGV